MLTQFDPMTRLNNMLVSNVFNVMIHLQSVFHVIQHVV